MIDDCRAYAARTLEADPLKINLSVQTPREVGPKQWVARCGDMASHSMPLAQAKTATRRMVVSGLHAYRVTDVGAPDLNNMAVQCLECPSPPPAITVRASPGIEVLSTSDSDAYLLRDIVRLERG